MASAAALGLIAALVTSIAASALYSRVLRTSGINDPLPLDWPAPPKPGTSFPAAKHAVAEKLGEGELLGPEGMALDLQGRYLYATCIDGWIRRLSLETGRIQNWTYVGGRPLGIVAGLGGEMIVCEPEQGLLNVTEGNAQVLSSEAAGMKYRLADGVDVAEDGTVYFTDASTRFSLHDYDLDMLEGRPYGRLLKYSPHSGETSVLLEGLYFPNGVALSEKQDFLVFCESSRVRLQRYWLRGDKQGTSEVLVDNLPGLPDNVQRYGNVFWVALLGGRSAFWERLLRLPLAKHLFGSWRLLHHHLCNSHARVLAISEDGQPLELYEIKSINFVTSGMRIQDSLYLGSLVSSYGGRIKLHTAPEQETRSA